MDDDKVASATSEAHKLLGRGSPAGKALYNLYNKGEGTRAGNKYNDRNAVMHQNKLSTGWVPTKPEKKLPVVSKPKVAVPTFTLHPPPSEERMAEYRVASIPHRRPIEVIRRQIEEEYERMRNSPMPPCTRTVLDEAEKDRLANFMRYRGKLPATINSGDASAAALRGPTSRKISTRTAGAGGEGERGRQKELESLFEAVVKEMDERREFLRDLERNGALKKEILNSVSKEIRDRVKELEKIDSLIRDEQ
mmetsp:Transcript_12955/g.23045  ORF Transcript_12955/g.23045 Transcript_12955/m.23045 type:complete len:250 (-) Transcript_12955:156-905(-)|eukprot:CAMPEP_0175061406 /NCGR_PEP_ID=MMETSP0052_2-20121109/13563_1 /TAXON_ID=51329 ORGANISM="Polytomella parva, Strain SAG 63-3" /NCGR_SAMPLE_ID=MMETSP0052_2 /ASSEMBLY_ACC=CAM_ASM_000194 /LENGTH=249 /DNA_ID=CAMNT_0016327249 /DNA_START=32 /DNA_END=781 /DNA_ORIENTATION=-